MRSHRRKRASRGFSLAEIVVALGILGVIAVIIFASVNTTKTAATTRERIDQAVAALDNLARAAAFFEATKPAFSFHQTLGVYPGRLSHLVLPITTSQLNGCGVPYTSGQVTAWPGAGPYYSANIPVTGLKIADGFVAQDSLVRSPVNTATASAGVLYIVIPNVTRDDAAALSLAADGDSTGSLGVVRFVTNGALPVQVNYRIEVGGC